MQTADVVIIGGGIVGSSIAYHLTTSGCKNVLVIERESAQGKGSTGKSMGGVRAQFSTAINIQMSLYSIPFYAEFDEIVGHPAGYRAQGYLFVATRESHLAYLKANFPLEYMTALLTSEIGHSAVGKEEGSKLVTFLTEADAMGIQILKPDVQKSFSRFSIEEPPDPRIGRARELPQTQPIPFGAPPREALRPRQSCGRHRHDASVL